MQLATPGLVLHTTNYSETSVIAKVFTRQLGVRSYILKGIRKAGSRTKQNLLQPLSYLDLVVYNNPKTQINYLKEVAPHDNSLSEPLESSSIEDDMIRNSLRFFMNEMLYKTLREEEPNFEIFDFAAQMLQEIQQPISSEHGHLPIRFMLQLSAYLGIEPLDNYSLREPLFNMNEGRFASPQVLNVDAPYAPIVMSDAPSALLHYYQQAIHGGHPYPLATLSQRTELINRLLEYYQIHLVDFRNFKSHEILHTVLR